MIIGDLELADELDEEGDLRAEPWDNIPLFFFDEDDAKALIEHLRQVFGLVD